MSIPSDIKSYLTSDETLLKTGRNGEWEIYITDRRVIFKKNGWGKKIIEASYRYISSIEYEKESRLGYIIGGVMLLIFAFGVWYLFPSLFPILYSMTRKIFSWLFDLIVLLLGLVGLALFFVNPQGKFKIHVVGREPLTVSGRLEEIIKIIRQYREKVLAEITSSAK